MLESDRFVYDSLACEVLECVGILVAGCTVAENDRLTVVMQWMDVSVPLEAAAHSAAFYQRFLSCLVPLRKWHPVPETTCLGKHLVCQNEK